MYTNFKTIAHIINESNKEETKTKVNSTSFNTKDIIDSLVFENSELSINSDTKAKNYIKALDQIKLLKESEYILGLDTEVFGHMDHSETFTVTEAALVGKRKGEKAKSVHNFKASIQKKNENKIYNMIKAYLEGKELSEESTKAAYVMVERLPFMGDKRKDPTLLMPIENNIEGLIKDATRFGNYEYGTERAAIEAKKIYDNIVDAKNKGIPLIGHNFNNSDASWVNRLFKDHNLPEIDFSEMKVIDTLELIRTASEDKLNQLFHKAGLGNLKGMQTLGSISKLTNQKLDAHIAESDIKANVNTLFDKVTGTDETFLDVIEKHINQELKKNKTSVLNVGDNQLLYAVKSVKKNNILDTVVGADGGTQDFRDYVTSRNVYYKYGGVSYTPADKLPEKVAKEHKNGIYSAKLEMYGDGLLNNTSIISAGSIDELENKINSHFSVYDIGDTDNIGKKIISQETAKKQLKYYEEDLARRSFESIFDVTSNKGFEYAENMYDTLNRTKDILGEHANKENLSNILKNGFIDIDDKRITLDEVIGNFSKEKFRDFVNMYDVLEDSNETMSKAISIINKNIDIKYFSNSKNTIEKTDEILRRKTAMLSSFKKELELLSGYSINTMGEEIPDLISSTSYGTVKINNEYKNINISTREAAKNDFTRLIYSSEKNTDTLINTNSKRVARLREVTQDLYDRGIVDEKILKEINNSVDVNSASKRLGSIIYSNGNNARREIVGNNFSDFSKINKISVKRFGDGAKLNELSVDDFVKENSKEMFVKKYGGVAENYGTRDIVKDIIEGISYDNRLEFINRHAKFSKFNSNNNKVTKEYMALVNNLREPLKTVGYDEKHVYAVADMIAGDTYSYFNRGYSVTLSKYNNKGHEEMGLVAYKPGDRNSVFKDLTDGVTPKKAILHPLPTIENEVGGMVQYARKGTQKKKITSSLIGFKNNNHNSNGFIEKNSYKYKVTDTVTEAIRAPQMIHDTVDQHVNNGNFDAANKRTNMKVNDKLINESGVSSNQTVNVNNTPKKMYIPTMSDVIKEDKFDSLLTSVPVLYREDEVFRKAMDKAIGFDEAEEIINKIDNKYLNGGIIEFENLNASHLSFGQWFQGNLIDGIGIGQRIIDAGILGDKETEFLKTYINGNSSQLLRPKALSTKVSIAKDFTPEQFTVGSHNTNPRRPQLNSTLNSKPMLNSEFDDINELKERLLSMKSKDIGIELGDISRTTNSHNYFINLGEQFKHEGGVTGALYGYIKQMAPEEVQIAMSNINTEDVLDRYIKEVGKSSWTNEDLDDLNDIINQIRSGGTTYEQHSIINPVVRENVRFNNETFTFNFGDDKSKLSIKEGDEIKIGDIISSITNDGETKEVHYRGKPGIVTEIDFETGKATVAPIDPAFKQKKYITGGFEKSVGTAYNTTTSGKQRSKLAEVLYKYAFGDATVQVAHFTYGKHEAGSLLINSNINIMTSLMRNNGDEISNNAVVDLINKNMVGWNARFVSDEVNGIGKVLVTDVNTKNSSNDILGVKNLIKDIEDLSINSDNKNTRDLAKKIVDNINYAKENKLLYLPITNTPLSESISTSGANGGKGIKYTPRLEQVFGIKYTDGYRTEKNGELVKVAQPIIDMYRNEVKNSSRSKSAQHELKNISLADKLAKGDKNVNTDRVKKISIDDLPLLTTGNMDSISLVNSVYGQFKDKYDVLEVDLGNNYFNDYFSGNTKKPGYKKTNKIYVPIGNTYEMEDGSIFTSKTTKNYNDLLLDLQSYYKKEPYKGKSLNDLYENINEKLKNLSGTLSHEMNDKNGLMNEYILSGRLSFSSGELGAGIIDMHFIDGIDSEILHPLGKQFIYKNAEGKNNFLDVAFVSRDLIDEMGITSDTIINQMLYENMMPQKFKEQLIEEGLLNKKGELNYNFNYSIEDYKITTPSPVADNFDNWVLKNQVQGSPDELEDLYEIYVNSIREGRKEWKKGFYEQRHILKGEYEKAFKEKIVSKYLENVGIRGMMHRNPTINKKSGLAAWIKTSNTLKGKAVLITDPSAKGMNADIDGDNIYVKFFLEESPRGEVKMITQKDILQSTDKMIELQAIDNRKYLEGVEPTKVVLDKNGNPIQAILSEGEAKKRAVNFTMDLDQFYENGINLYGDNFKKNTNYIANEDVRKLTIAVGTNKAGIGVISISGKKLKDVTDAFAMQYEYLNSLYPNIDNKTLERVVSFSTLAEQKLIDVKHVTSDLKAAADMFSKGVTVMAESDGDIETLNKGFSTLIQSMIDGGAYSEDEFKNINVDDIINGKYDKSNEAINELKAVYDILNTEEGREAYLEVLSNPHASFNNAIEESKDILDDLNKSKLRTGIGQRKVDVLNDILDDINALGISKYTDYNNTLVRKDKFTGEGDIVKILKYREDGDNKYVQIIDTINDTKSEIKGKTYNEIGEYLKNIYNSVEDINENDKILANMISFKKKVDDSIKNVDNVTSRIVAAEMFDRNMLDIKEPKNVKDIKANIGKVLKDFEVTNNVDSITREVLNEIRNVTNNRELKKRDLSIFSTIASNTIDFDTRKAIVTVNEEVKKGVRNKKIDDSIANKTITEMNDRIIERGKKARANNAITKEKLIDETNKVLNILLEKPIDNVDDVVKEFKIEKLIIADEVSSMLDDSKKTVIQRLNKRGFSEDEIANVMSKIEVNHKSVMNKVKSQNNSNIIKNTKAYFEHINVPGVREKILKWNISDTEDIISLGNSKVGFGFYADLSLKDMSIEDLTKAMLDTETIKAVPEYTSAIEESKSRIKKYINLVNVDNQQYNINKTLYGNSYVKTENFINVDKINEDIIRKAEIQKANRVAKESAEDTVKETIDTMENLNSKSKKWYKNKYLIAGGVAIGLLATANAARRKNENGYLEVPGEKNKDKENGENSVQPKLKTLKAPPSNPTKSSSNGVIFKVKGKAKHDISNEEIVNSVNANVESVVGGNVNINTNQQDSREDVSESWLKRKFMEMVK